MDINRLATLRTWCADLILIYYDVIYVVDSVKLSIIVARHITSYYSLCIIIIIAALIIIILMMPCFYSENNS